MENSITNRTYPEHPSPKLNLIAERAINLAGFAVQAFSSHYSQRHQPDRCPCEKQEGKPARNR